MKSKAVTSLWGLVFFSMCFSVEANWLQVPAGEVTAFWLSPMSPKEKKKTVAPKLKIKPFQVMSHPVTIGQFGRFLKDSPDWSRENLSGLFKDEHYLKEIEFTSENLNRPITYVSWFAARAYCESVQARLPTLYEWEYMAAASEKMKDANNNEKFLRRILDWYGEPKGAALKPVGSIYRNLYGVWDLHGLIWEWVEDFNTSFVTGESREDSSFNKDMFCGAGAMSSSNKENYAAFMRFAFRSGLKGTSSVWNLGFRCVR